MSSFSIEHWIVVALIAYVIYRIVAPKNKVGATLYCTSCGSEGPSKVMTKGSILIEIVLWLMFLFPGLVYSLWRLNTRYKACGTCESTALVPIDSPAAVAMKRQMTT